MSMKNLTKHMPNRNQTPQTQPIPGREKDMTENSAGGYSFTVDCWTRLNRFLILGTEKGSYYATEQKLTKENAACVEECLKLDGKRVVDIVTAISHGGRAPKNDPALFVLAMACKLGDENTKRLAYAALPQVARIGTDLFHWASAIKTFGGYTSGFQRAVSKWYLDRKPSDLALQAVKYQSRDGWAHKDMLRLSKPGGGQGRRGADKDSEQGHILGWLTDRWMPDLDTAPSDGTALIWAHEKAKAIGQAGVTNTGTKELVRLINQYRLPRECIPTAYLNEVAVWEALLDNGGQGMPLTALIRNLGKMTAIGLLAPMAPATAKVVSILKNEDALHKARIHPLKVLIALMTYKSGHGVKGSLTWNPVTAIVDALDEAFYLSFKGVEPTNKRWLLAVDISGSMDGGVVAGTPGITPRIGAAAMAMVTAKTEPLCHTVAFASGKVSYGGTPDKKHWQAPRGYDYHYRWSYSDGLTPVDLSSRRRLNDVVETFRKLPAGGTDCSLPMVYALEQKIPVDVFVIFTDSETWAGKIAPVQALAEYRRKMNIPAKLIVVGMVANGFSIADPKDAGMLDVVGFDGNAPAIMAEFAKGNL